MRLIDADDIVFYQWIEGIEEYDFARRWQIDKIPTIDAVPVKHGEWTIINGCVSCSVCGEPCMEFNYCPNCGAKMDEERKDSDV